MSEQMFGRPAVASRSPSMADPSGGQFHDLPIFAGLQRKVVERLLERSRSRSYDPGALILKQGEPARSLHIIRRGIVDLTHLSAKSECGVLLLSARDLLLPATMLFDEPALVSARALTNTRMLEIEGEAIERALVEHPVFAANLIKTIAGHWRMAVRNILDLNCRTAAQRVGAFLLRIADLQQDCSAPVLPIAKRHVAVRLGMTAETLSRMLQTVADHGLHLRGRTIVIRDRAAIEEFCGPDPYPVRNEHSLDVFAL